MASRGDSGASLKGLRVIEIGRFITAPFAAMVLADLGAEVIKVEPPEGDPFRIWREDEISPRFLAFNRGKKSVTLDLSDDSDREALDRLLGTSDVLVHNFRPAGAERLGLGWDRLSSAHPRLILCSISGGGEEGAYADRPMYDQIGQALSGMMSVFTDREDPQPVGPAMSDALTGMYAAIGILAALNERQTTGRGVLVTSSLLQATVSFMGEPASHYFATGEVPGPLTRPRQSQSFGLKGSDGLPFVIHLSTPRKFWLGLLDVLGRPELDDDPRFCDYNSRVANYDALLAEIEPVIARRPTEEWLTRLGEADVPCAPVRGFDAVADDPELKRLGAITEIPDWKGDLLPTVGRGVNVGGQAGPLAPAPKLGEHNDEIPGRTKE